MKSFVITCIAFGFLVASGCQKSGKVAELERILPGLDRDRNPMTRPVDTLRSRKYSLNPAVYDLTIQPIWTDYLAIGQALAVGDSVRAGKLADQLAARNFEIESYQGSDVHLGFVKAQLQTIKLYLSSNWTKRTLAEQRTLYESVSGAGFGLFTYVGLKEEQVHRYFSKAALDSAGAFWMQPSSVIPTNPYTGKTDATDWRLTEVIAIRDSAK